MSQAVSLRSRFPQGPPLHRLTIIADSATALAFYDLTLGLRPPPRLIRLAGEGAR